MTLYALDGVAPTLPEGDDYWVAPGAHVIGNVVLGVGVSVWFGSVLRGDNEAITLEDGVNIQENCVLHTDPGFPMTLGAGATIGHKAMLHGCTIGPGSLIGMGATVLNGARIGAGCLIGAGALITEGKVIADHSLVMGAPGRVIRQLSPDDIAGLRRSADHYIANSRRFRQGLVPL
ncbi:MAG: gamma carbonic anhydrase family protein [Qingshengfaniella sp.]